MTDCARASRQLCDFVMRLGSGGEAYFVEETDEPPASEEEITSPILSPRYARQLRARACGIHTARSQMPVDLSYTRHVTAH